MTACLPAERNGRVEAQGFSAARCSRGKGKVTVLPANRAGLPPLPRTQRRREKVQLPLRSALRHRAGFFQTPAGEMRQEELHAACGILRWNADIWNHH